MLASWKQQISLDGAEEAATALTGAGAQAEVGTATPAPLPWVALTLLRFARLNATAILPTPPGLDAARPVPKYQIPALQGPAVGLAPALHPGFSGGTDTLVLITSSSGSPIPGSPPLLAWVSCPRVTRNYSIHKI